MKSLTIVMGLTALAVASGLAQDSASSIVEKFERQKAEALQAYLKANPSAGDRADALDALIHAYAEVDDNVSILPFLEEKYTMVKGTDVRTQLQTLQALVTSYAAAGQKDKAFAMLDAAPADLGPIGKDAQITQILAQFRSALNVPGVGGEFEIAFTDLNGHKVDLAEMKG